MIMKSILRQTCLILIPFILGGCASLELPAWLNPVSGRQPTPIPQQTQTATAVSPVLDVTPTSSALYRKLVVWVPPQWDPESGSLPASLLAVQLQSFEEINPDVDIEIRVKAVEGAGGLMESLTTSAASAPLALPSLAAMRVEDLESAVGNGVIYPLEDSLMLEDPDWFNYAREISQVKNTVYGLPFAGDAILLLQKQQEGIPTPQTWQDILRRGQPILFPAASNQSMLSFNLYLSAGGTFGSGLDEPLLQQEILKEVFDLYAFGSQSGVFPYWISQYENDQQALEAFQSGQADSLITWTSTYLSDPQEYTITVLPSLHDGAYSLATGWVWVLTDPLPERRDTSIQLAEHLVDSGFLATWSPLAKVLPVRPSSTSGWGDATLQAEVTRIAQSAHRIPEDAILTSYGPVLQNATLQIIKIQISSTEAAQTVMDELNSP